MTNTDKLDLIRMTQKSLRERDQRKATLHLIEQPIERVTQLEPWQTIIAPGITLTNETGASVTFTRFGNLFKVSNAQK